MNKRKLKEIAKEIARLEIETRQQTKEIARLELESRQQDNRLEKISAKIENIIDSLSVEELFQLDEYIRQELKCL